MQIDQNELIRLFKISNKAWAEATKLKEEANRLMNESASALTGLNELIYQAAIETYNVAPLVSPVIEGNTISRIRVVIPMSSISLHVYEDGRIIYED